MDAGHRPLGLFGPLGSSSFPRPVINKNGFHPGGTTKHEKAYLLSALIRLKTRRSFSKVAQLIHSPGIVPLSPFRGLHLKKGPAITKYLLVRQGPPTWLGGLPGLEAVERRLMMTAAGRPRLGTRPTQPTVIWTPGSLHLSLPKKKSGLSV